MDNMKCHSSQTHGVPKPLRYIVLIIFVSGGVYYLWNQHRAHLFQYFPFFLYLLCPLMHLFHGHQGKHEGHHHLEGGKS